MGITPKDILKSWFETNSTPSQEEFESLIDSIQEPIRSLNGFINTPIPDGTSMLSNYSIDTDIRSFRYADIRAVLFGSTVDESVEEGFIPNSAIAFKYGSAGNIYIIEKLESDISYPISKEDFNQEIYRAITEKISKYQRSQLDEIPLVSNSKDLANLGEGRIKYRDDYGQFKYTNIFYIKNSYIMDVLPPNLLVFAENRGVLKTSDDGINTPTSIIATRNKEYTYIVTPEDWKTILSPYINRTETLGGGVSILFTKGVYNIDPSQIANLMFYDVNLIEGETGISVGTDEDDPQVLFSIKAGITSNVFYMMFSSETIIRNIHFEYTNNYSISANTQYSLFRFRNSYNEHVTFENCLFRYKLLSAGYAAGVHAIFSIANTKNSLLTLNIRNCKFDISNEIANTTLTNTICLYKSLTSSENKINAFFENSEIIAYNAANATPATALRVINIFEHGRSNLKVSNCNIKASGYLQGSIFRDTGRGSIGIKDCIIDINTLHTSAIFTAYDLTNETVGIPGKSSYFRDSIITVYGNSTSHKAYALYNRYSPGECRMNMPIENVSVSSTLTGNKALCENILNVRYCTSPSAPISPSGFRYCYSGSLSDPEYECDSSFMGGWCTAN